MNKTALAEQAVVLAVGLFESQIFQVFFFSSAAFSLTAIPSPSVVSVIWRLSPAIRSKRPVGRLTSARSALARPTSSASRARTGPPRVIGASVSSETHFFENFYLKSLIKLHTLTTYQVYQLALAVRSFLGFSDCHQLLRSSELPVCESSVHRDSPVPAQW